MTAYMVANDLEPGCIGVKTTLKRRSPHEQSEPEARLEPIETYVLGEHIVELDHFLPIALSLSSKRI